MSLDDIRDASRKAVHDTFALPATVTSPDGLTVIPGLTVRLHRKNRKPFGDLGSEGFALIVETEDAAIFDKEEWYPEMRWRVDFGRGRLFRIAEPPSEFGERYMRVKLVEYTED